MMPHIALFILVFGFVFAIVLQAWFVRKAAHLASGLQDRRETYKQLAQEVAELSEEVSGFSTAIDTNTVSIAGLEREIEGLQERLAEFAAEHDIELPKPKAKTKDAAKEVQRAAKPAAAGDAPDGSRAAADGAVDDSTEAASTPAPGTGT